MHTEACKSLVRHLLLSALLCAFFLIFPFRVQAEPIATSLSNSTPTECLFNWAEKNYPALFAPAGSTHSLTVYSYRYYSATNAYLGVNSVNNHVYYLGPEGVLQDVGPLSDWSPKAGCQVPPPSPSECLFNWAEINYPSLFAPAGSPWAISSIDWTYRYYSLTNAYLRIQSADYHVYYMGPDGLSQDVGPLAEWTPKASCRPPVANAGPDQTATVGATVTLDGSASSDLDGNLINYRWTLSQKPASSQTVLSNSTALHPTLAIDKPGTYQISLIVNDGQFASAPATVIINTQNSKPVANAGTAQSGKVGDTLALDGSASQDVDGDTVTYRWTLLAKPQNSSAQLNNPDTVSPSLTLDKSGSYTAQLIVNDGKTGSDPATVILSTVNSKPVAKAGPGQSLLLTTPAPSVQLDGSGSSDADSDPLSFRWALISKPAGSQSVLLDPLALLARFTPDFVGDYVAQLIVNDGHVDSDPNTAQITVTAPPPPPQNHPPHISTSPVLTATVDQSYSYDLDAADSDNDTLTYSLSVYPSSMTINAGTGSISWTPAAGQTGPQSVKATVIDGKGGSDSQSFEIVVAEAPIPNQTTVPEVTGATRTAAQTAFHQAKLNPGTETFQHSDTVPDGKIISQSPSANNKVDIGTAINTVVSLGTDNHLPPNPETVAPALDTTVATNTYAASQFLYSGSNPIQTLSNGQPLAAGTIEPKRAAVIRGKVFDKQNNPLSGVSVSIKDHPELGQTLSRADGQFDLAVNGGGTQTINYKKTSYLPAQRQVTATWQNYTFADDAILMQQDTKVSTVNLDDTTQNFQVAQGNPVTDQDGTRQATLIIPNGTQAQIYNQDGTTKSVSTLNLRLTEYTTGANGPESMPGPLPPSSAYTYAFEMKADEADVKIDGKDVLFDRPVPFYIDNFLNFPVGTAVPVGYYDRDKAAWVPSDNGKVIEILSINNGIASLDTDGDAAADDAVKLAALGVTSQEQARLASLYSVGQTLWRVQVTHLSTWDCNWPYKMPDDAVAPTQKVATHKDYAKLCATCPAKNAPTELTGSIIEAENQILRESIPVIGTGMTINYASDRVPGRTLPNKMDIPVSGATLPNSIKAIDLVVEVAGHRFKQRLPADKYKIVPFSWDGVDAFGRAVTGLQSANVKIGYVYDPVYAKPAEIAAAFGRFSGVPLEGSSSRKEVRIWQYQKTFLGGSSVGTQDAAGWSLSAHHRYDPVERILYQGDGRRRNAQSTTAAGGGVTKIAEGLGTIAASITAPDGSIFISTGNKVQKITPDGTVTTVAGSGVAGFSGDGGPGTAAKLDSPQGLALASDGSLYIADSMNSSIRKLSPNGIISTIAGQGSSGPIAFSCHDGLSATAAPYINLSTIAVGPDGSIYFSGSNIGHNKVCKIGPDGMLSTVAGSGKSGFSGDGGPALEAKLFNPDGLVVGQDGSLYIADRANFRIRKVTPDGIITTIAGNGISASSGDGGLAINASFKQLGNQIALSASGELLVADSGPGTIRKITNDGLIITIAGGGKLSVKNAPDGALPTSVHFLFGPQGDISVRPDGDIVFATGGGVYKLTSPFSGFSGGEVAIPSDDGSQLYRFDPKGRHLSTLGTLTGKSLLSFAYDTKGRLSTVTDINGLVTSIERDSLGNATAIVAPFGQRTTLQSNPNGYLAKVSNPASEAYQMTYGVGGLLAAFKDPRGNASSFVFDAEGRLLSDSNAAGGKLNLARTELADGSQIAATTAEGLTSTYTVHDAVTGERVRESRSPDGTSMQSSFANDGTQTTTLPDDTVITEEQGPDPRIGFGMLAPVTTSSTVTTGGLTATVSADRAVALAFASDPLSLTKLTETSTLNGRTSTSVYDAATKTITSNSPANRKTTALTDAQGRIIQAQVTGIFATNAAYDAQGRLATVSQGTGADERKLDFTYNPQGYLASVLDPIGRQVQFQYDQAGRVTTQTLPDGRQILYSYDAKGNLTSLTPPGQPAHVFNYTAVDQTTDYVPPVVGAGSNSTVYTYDKDKVLTSVARPDGQSIDLNHDSAGRVSSLVLQPGNLTLASYAYNATTGKLTDVSAPDGGLGFTYNGALLTQTAWTGSVSGSVGYGYDNDFRISSVNLNGADPIAYTYDSDSLLTKAGSLTLTRSAQNGLLTTTKLGNLSDSYSYSSFGELAGYEAKYSSFSHLKLAYTRDKLGRITQKQETRGGVLVTYDYGYDTAGRLVQVKKNSAVQSSYVYDDNGNRLSRITPSGTQTGTYDAQDRLLTYNGAIYSYTANGELETKTVGAASTTYDYDVLGNLNKVILPGGTVIDYLTDGQNRRIGKKVNGTLTQAFLWQGQLQPIAELDGNGNVVSRFVYATGVNVPDYMIKGGVTYRIIKDHLGSPRIIVDVATDTVVQEMEFDEFGKAILDTNPGFQPFGFAGGLYDRDTELVRFGVRDYDASVGRWVSKDPIGLNISSNVFSYNDSDPINFIDPVGLWRVDVGGMIGIGGGLIISGPGTAIGVGPIDVDAWIGLGAGVIVDGDPMGTGPSSDASLQFTGSANAHWGDLVKGSGGFQIGPAINSKGIDWFGCSSPSIKPPTLRDISKAINNPWNQLNGGIKASLGARLTFDTSWADTLSHIQQGISNEGKAWQKWVGNLPVIKPIIDGLSGH